MCVIEAICFSVIAVGTDGTCSGRYYSNGCICLLSTSPVANGDNCSKDIVLGLTVVPHVDEVQLFGIHLPDLNPRY
jgi:hypothetical protein